MSFSLSFDELSSCSFLAPPNMLDRLFTSCCTPPGPGIAAFGKPGTDVLTVPDVEYPAAGSRLPNLYSESLESADLIEGLLLLVFGSLVMSVDDVLVLGVPGAVLPGVAEGLCFSDGG